jgi:hypothetical protein
VLLSTIVVVGGLAYWPVRERQREFNDRVKEIERSIVPRSEHVERWRIIERDIDRMTAAITANQAAIVPRGEHQEQWNSQRARDVDLDRRIEDLRKLFGETYSLRDALKAMQERLDRIETGRAQSRGANAGS